MKRKSYYIIFLVLAVCCREKFMPQINAPSTGYLVMEGIINSGAGPTNILLSRTNKIADDSLQYENGAIVQVEGNDNSTYDLAEKGNGMYSSDQLNLSNSQQYRLRIKTTDGKEYLSDFVSVKNTPAIDSVGWRYGNDGLHIYLNTHDPQNNTRYYYWNFDESWEYHMPFVPQLKLVDTQYGFYLPKTFALVRADYDPSLYACWNTDHSTQILLGSSAKLSEDIIGNAPIAFVPNGSAKLSVMYSILVKQYALSTDAYAFLQRMKKNTEQTGSVFDPQPAELKGNIHCTSNPGENVLGFVTVCPEQTKRIFIKSIEVPDWNYHSECHEDTIDAKITPIEKWEGEGYIPVDIVTQHADTSRFGDPTRPRPPIIDTYTIARPECTNCTLTGSNIKPSFWP